jgi:hypothetical protein
MSTLTQRNILMPTFFLRHQSSRITPFSVLLAMWCWSFLPMTLPALEMGPGMFMVQAVPPGREVNLRKLGGVLFTVTNRSDHAMDYTLSCHRPKEGGLPTWEQGYEEIPNAAWCYLEETTITVPAKSEKQVGLIINIPDEPENYNRKFMLAVILNTGKVGNTSVGLAVACRVQIETAINDHLDSSTAAPLAVVPGTITLSGKPGATVSGSVLVRNNTSGRIDATVVRLPQVYADPMKHPRYDSNGFQPQKEPWLAPQTAAFPLAAGGGTLLSFTGTIPATAEVGKKYEELAFIRATMPDGKELMTFVRLHCQVPAAESAKVESATPAITPAAETPIKP